MIENDRQLEHSVEQLAKMYRLRDREASETAWDADTREDIIEGTLNVIRKVEREIGEYLAAKYTLVKAQPESVA